MPIIQRCDKADGDAEGCDYLKSFREDIIFPIWTSKDRAWDVPENLASAIAGSITNKFGYTLVIGSNVNTERQQIIEDMKSGKLEKSKAVEILRNLSTGGQGA